MAHRIRAQRKGRSDLYKAPSHRYNHTLRYPRTEKILRGTIVDILFDPARTAPLAKITYEDGTKSIMLAPESLTVGKEVQIGEDVPVEIGNTLPLKKMPEGIPLHNIEIHPGDGGKLIRSSGSSATLISKTKKSFTKQLAEKILQLLKN